MLNDFADRYLIDLGASDFAPRPSIAGRLASYDGLLMEAIGLSLPVGTICAIGSGDGAVEAEVIGFRSGRTIMMNL
ncbi:MAG: flagellum-specific ATP synthase FliI, partial [Sphingomonadales bacterium]|nr:flagellum-specific ATP synthase FliI [Sphingomonadales bacterium]